MKTKPCLTLEDCRRITAACEAEAKKNHWNVTIAILDDGGHVLLLTRMDGASPVTAEIGGDHVEVPPQIGGDPVPAAAMIPPPVHQEQRRRVRIAPVDVMLSQPLGEEAARGGTRRRQRSAHPIGGRFLCQPVARS